MKIQGQPEIKTKNTGLTDRKPRIALQTLNKTLQGINGKTRLLG